MSKGKGSPAAEICRKTAIGCGKGEPESLYASYEFWKEAGGVTGAATHSKQHGEAADRCAGDPVGAEPCGAVCRAVLRAAGRPGGRGPRQRHPDGGAARRRTRSHSGPDRQGHHPAV